MGYTRSNSMVAKNVILSIGPLFPSASPTYLPILEVSKSDHSGRKAAVESATNFNSGGVAEKKKSYRDLGRWEVGGNRVSSDAGQIALRNAWLDPTGLYMFLAEYDLLSGQTVREYKQFSAFVTDFSSSLDVGQKVSIAATLDISGTQEEQYANASGQVAYISSGGTAQHPYAAMWSGFALKPTSLLPPDMAIVGIYPVIVCSMGPGPNYPIPYLEYGTGLGLTNVLQGSAFTLPHAVSQGFAGTEFYAPTLGTSLAALAGFEVVAMMDATLSQSYAPCVLAATAVGCAVYYTASQPEIDTQIPAPFAVPAGQGLAWALPFTQSQTGVGVNGYGLATPAGAL